MPVELSDLLANECWVDVEVANGSFRIAYRPETTSLLRQAELMKRMRLLQSQTDGDEIEQVKETAKILCEVVSNWDLTDKGQPLPLTPEVVAGVIPGSWIDPIMQAINNSHARSQEEKKALKLTSGATSTREDRLAIAQNGIQSSAPRGTWASHPGT